MTAKSIALKAIEELPADASLEDAMERLIFIAKVREGMRQADQGDVISHADAKRRLKRWLPKKK